MVIRARTRLEKGEQERVHKQSTFAFDVPFAMSRVAPLFGGDGERAWAKGWNPDFIYPRPARDVPGAVFSVAHGKHSSTWLTTIYDLKAGHIQHVSFIAGSTVTLWDIRLKANGEAATHVEVTYQRTALDQTKRDEVQERSSPDAHTGDTWRKAIIDALEKISK